MSRDDLGALLPLAFGHDQEASACPWVQLTRRTADYPSRKAQAALAMDLGTLPITPDLVDLLYRCDDCGRCRAASILVPPVDLPRILWQVRSSLVATGQVPEVAALAETWRQHGNVYGDLGPGLARLGPGDEGAEILFVPGAATLFYTPEAAMTALRAVRSVVGPIDLRADLIDSGHTLRELGLLGAADAEQDHLRRQVVEAKHRMVVAGTPKEAFGLREALAELPIEVRYAGSVAATGGPSGPRGDGIDCVVFHPSETLLHRSNEFEAIDRWLASRLGERYRRETDARQHAWPGAIERPAVRVPTALTRALAEQRLAQLWAIVDASRGGPMCPPFSAVAEFETGRTDVSAPTGVAHEERFTILTTDPFSWRALREVAPAGVEVVDLLVFAEGNAEV